MQQNLLYPETLLVHLPPDILVYPELVTEREEQDLLAEFSKFEWKQFHQDGVIVRRRVIPLRLDSALTTRAPRAYERLPLCLEPILPRMARAMRCKPADIAEVQVLHYPHGAGIAWHHDSDVFGEVIAGLTLESGCVMKFRHEVGAQYEVFRTEIPERGAYVISGESRWDWQHTIASHQTPRYAVLFRTAGTPGEFPQV